MSESPSFEAALAAAARIALEHLHSLPQRRVAHASVPAAPSPPDGAGFDAALELLRRQIQPWLSSSPGPRYLGFVTGGVTPEALAADWLASAFDQNVSNAVGSIAADVERATVASYAQAFGIPAAMHGQFVSGATAANLVCLATAREWAATLGTGRAAVFAGAAHSSILKAMSITGLGRDAHRAVATLPGRTAVDVEALERALAQHDGPAIVVASAGEVNTGDFDDLAALADLCARYGAWLHVDGAFGLFAALLPELAPRLAGIERAHSITVDLHKWLNVPYDSALAFTSRPDLQRSVFAASSAYLGSDPDPLHYTPENSRRFRALAPWMVMATRGRAGIARWVRANCAQARALAAGLEADGRFEVLGGVPLNIVCFALRDGDAAARDRFLARVTASGETFMTPTILFGRPGVRAAFSNWATGDDDVARILAAILVALAEHAA
jgi:glutamate/tyrosine decarboxylase-like PLP-dependent enzyme